MADRVVQRPPEIHDELQQALEEWTAAARDLADAVVDGGRYERVLEQIERYRTARLRNTRALDAYLAAVRPPDTATPAVQ